MNYKVSTGKKFIFTMTAGRTGTHYLASLLKVNLPDAEVHHERLGYDQFGVNTPEISHLTLFNSQGNVPPVRAFWRQKLTRIAQTQARYYVETSHILMKAGLIENIEILLPAGEVHLVCLHRDMLKTMLSYHKNYDFTNLIMLWAWYLDPKYPRKLVAPNSQLNRQLDSDVATSLWYLCEIQARQAYYKKLLSQVANVVIHDLEMADLNDKGYIGQFLTKLGVACRVEEIIIPPPQGVTQKPLRLSPVYVQQLKRIIMQMQFDPDRIAQDYIDRGKRLG